MPVTSYTYRSIGTNIDCRPGRVEGGLFKLDLGVSDTSVFIPENSPRPAAWRAFRRSARSHRRSTCC